MSSLILQIFFCLLLAALLGCLIGWFIQRLFCRKRERALEDSWARQVRKAEQTRDEALAGRGTTQAQTRPASSHNHEQVNAAGAEGIGKLGAVGAGIAGATAAVGAAALSAKDSAAETSTSLADNVPSAGTPLAEQAKGAGTAIQEQVTRHTEAAGVDVKETLSTSLADQAQTTDEGLSETAEQAKTASSAPIDTLKAAGAGLAGAAAGLAGSRLTASATPSTPESVGTGLADKLRPDATELQDIAGAAPLGVQEKLRAEAPTESAQAVTTELTEAAATFVPGSGPTGKIETEYMLEKIEGVDAHLNEQFRSMQMRTTHDLLDQCHSAEARTTVARRLGIEESVLGPLASRSDLMRVPGLRPQFASLLYTFGIHSIQELIQQDSQMLAAQIGTSTATTNPALPLPIPSTIAGWIEYARSLAPRISG